MQFASCWLIGFMLLGVSWSSRQKLGGSVFFFAGGLFLFYTGFPVVWSFCLVLCSPGPFLIPSSGRSLGPLICFFGPFSVLCSGLLRSLFLVLISLLLLSLTLLFIVEVPVSTHKCRRFFIFFSPGLVKALISTNEDSARHNLFYSYLLTSYYY